jgi:UDP-N-acetylglucosamine--N-acetylmuramyl-(pentapeptide) pyrophosphoryl-undecaprenol N-acetylglucosamine transferase
MDDERQSTPSAPDRERHALFAGGGSAGHVFPGLAIADVLAARGWTVTWTGRPAGMERTLVERAGTRYVPLSAAPLVGQGLAGKMRALFTLLLSSWRGRRLVRALGAGIVVGTGGYVSAPAVLGARLGGVPSLLLEPNARAGAANRFLSRWATGAAVAFADAAPDFACPVETTGAPVRAAFHKASVAEDRPHPALLVVGGSQGALQINELMPRVVEQLAGRVASLHVLHQTGVDHLERVREDYTRRRLGGVELETVAFLEDMPAAMAAADLVVSRAGAITLAEICAAALPAVLVPLRHAGAHQLDNARGVESVGGAVVLADDEATIERMGETLLELLNDRERLAAMSVAAGSLAAPDAARRIADLVGRLEEAA